MKQEIISRRVFLKSASIAAHKSCIVLSMPMILTACERANQARLNGSGFSTLSIAEADELHAIAARIIPTDDTPGATEAGVIYFIDNVLGDQRETELAILQEGLKELQVISAENFSNDYFHILGPNQQDQLLANIESSEFFNTMRYLTIAGMFSLPEYGGNRDNIGYRVIGFDDRHAWQPPFGFYDADYNERGQ